MFDGPRLPPGRRSSEDARGASPPHPRAGKGRHRPPLPRPHPTTEGGAPRLPQTVAGPAVCLIRRRAALTGLLVAEIGAPGVRVGEDLAGRSGTARVALVVGSVAGPPLGGTAGVCASMVTPRPHGRDGSPPSARPKDRGTAPALLHNALQTLIPIMDGHVLARPPAPPKDRSSAPALLHNALRTLTPIMDRHDPAPPRPPPKDRGTAPALLHNARRTLIPLP
jgi:hypothetical protein